MSTECVKLAVHLPVRDWSLKRNESKFFPCNSEFRNSLSKCVSVMLNVHLTNTTILSMLWEKASTKLQEGREYSHYWWLSYHYRTLKLLVTQKETVNNKQKGYDVLVTNQLWLKLFHRVINILLTCLSVKWLRIYESHIFKLQIKMWMKVILAVMCTTWAVVKIRPEKIQACTGFDDGSR